MRAECARGDEAYVQFRAAEVPVPLLLEVRLAAVKVRGAAERHACRRHEALCDW